MKQLLRTAGVAGAALALSVALAACSDDDDTSAGDDNNGNNGGNTSETGEAAEPADQTFGDGCAEVPTDGPGSFDGMVKDPVATAASNNPLLTTLVSAVGSVDGLADTLNSSEELTVFAPYDPAFEEIPADQLNGMVKDAKKQGQDSDLYGILAHHVLGANNDPSSVTGEQDTLAGDQLTIEGDENGMTVSDGTVTANVICGNVPTANATVYVIDKVMTGVK